MLLLPPDVHQLLTWIHWWEEEQVKQIQRYNLLGEENADLQIFLTDLSQWMNDEWGQTVNTSKHGSGSVCVCVSPEQWALAVSLCIIKKLRKTRKHRSLSCLAGKLLFFYEGVSYWWLCCESVICSQTEITWTAPCFGKLTMTFWILSFNVFSQLDRLDWIGHRFTKLHTNMRTCKCVFVHGFEEWWIQVNVGCHV